MNKTVFIIYLIVFGIYIFFTRQPDFFDGEKTTAVIHFEKNSTADIAEPFAVYTIGKQVYKTNADYLFRSYTEGENCDVIYNPENPQKGVVYAVWGYWITWQELLASIALVVVLFQIAKTITSNPTPEGLLSELEDTKPPPKKRKYD